jgi:hypothetical protein
LAFTRNPSDTSVSPATYTADGASELFLVDQQRNIAIDGSDKNDSILVDTAALSSNALYNYNIRGFAGNDGIVLSAALIENSEINGNEGNDEVIVGNFTGTLGETSFVAFSNTSLSGSLVLGGKDDDFVGGAGVSNGELNGNIGDDTIVVDNDGFVTAGFNMYIGGGQGNDVVDINGNFTNSIIDGNKGSDTITIGEIGTHSNTSVNGGEDNDIIRVVSGSASKGLMLSGDKGNDTILSVGNEGSTIFGGEGNDTIVSEAAAGKKSTIDAGVGADFVATDSSAAAERIVFNSGDSVAATKTSGLGNAPGQLLTAGGVITFGDGVDIVTGFNENAGGTLTATLTNDEIVIDFDPAAYTIVNTTVLNTDTLATNEMYAVRGTFDLATNALTIGNAAGDTDYLYIVGGSNLTLGQVFTNSTSMFVSDALIPTNQFNG